MSIYDFKARSILGEDISMTDYKGKVLLIVNTASKWGLTPQFKELEELYMEYKDRGFEVLAFPSNQFANQDPGTNQEILEFAKSNYGVTFQMFEKSDVKGDTANPIFRYLVSQKKSIIGEGVKWNFTKFLVDREGNVVERYAPTTRPYKVKKDIEKLL